MRSSRHTRLALLVTAALLLSLLLKLNHLGHTELKGLDESFHALVAEHLMHHPLAPTLIERPLLPPDESSWFASHLWLHKPPMALWQIAASFFVFGINAFSLRLPSAILSTAAAWITYRIGTRLVDPVAGAVAAVLQAFNPSLLMLVHGYLFSDHVDVALLFWTEVGMLCIVCCAQAKTVNAARVAAACAGVAAGCAFLTKSYLALIVPAVAIGAWLLWRTIKWSTPLRVRGKSVAIMVSVAVATAAPYLLYAASHAPRQFSDAYLAMLSHVQQGVEGYGAPWDRLWFDYAADAFYVFYVTALISVAVLAIEMIRRRDGRIAFLVLWAGGVFVTMTVTANKTPSATVIGWPPVFVLIGGLVSLAWRGQSAALGAWLVAVIAAAVFPGRYLSGQMGGSDEFAAIARSQSWISWELLAAAGGVAAALAFQSVLTKRVRLVLKSTAALLTAWMFLAPRIAGRPGGYLSAAFRVTELNRQTPDLPEIGTFLKTLPQNAGILLVEKQKFERNALMFYGDRTVYKIDATETMASLAKQLTDAGAIPYVVTDQSLAMPKVFAIGERGVYRYVKSDRDSAPDGNR